MVNEIIVDHVFSIAVIIDGGNIRNIMHNEEQIKSKTNLVVHEEYQRCNFVVFTDSNIVSYDAGLFIEIYTNVIVRKSKWRFTVSLTSI